MTLLYICIEYWLQVNRHHVSVQGINERMIKVYCYYFKSHIRNYTRANKSHQITSKKTTTTKTTSNRMHTLKYWILYLFLSFTEGVLSPQLMVCFKFNHITESRRTT